MTRTEIANALLTEATIHRGNYYAAIENLSDVEAKSLEAILQYIVSRRAKAKRRLCERVEMKRTLRRATAATRAVKAERSES